MILNSVVMGEHKTNFTPCTQHATCFYFHIISTTQTFTSTQHPLCNDHKLLYYIHHTKLCFHIAPIIQEPHVNKLPFPVYIHYIWLYFHTAFDTSFRFHIKTTVHPHYSCPAYNFHTTSVKLDFISTLHLPHNSLTELAFFSTQYTFHVLALAHFNTTLTTQVYNSMLHLPHNCYHRTNLHFHSTFTTQHTFSNHNKQILTSTHKTCTQSRHSWLRSYTTTNQCLMEGTG